MARVSVNRGSLDTLINALDNADNRAVQSGWFESARYQDDGTPVAAIAAQNEYGNPKLSIPPRPFIRPTIEGQSANWSTIVEQGIKKAIENGTGIDRVLNTLGLKVSADIKNSIVSGDFKALSPVTIALRKIRNDGQMVIGGKLVGAVAGAIAQGKTGLGELGDQSFGNKDPLRETGYLISTITYEVT